MATPAQFVVVIDHELANVGNAQNHNFNFDMPANAELTPAVLQFMVHPANNAEDQAVNFSINEKRVYHYGTTSEDITRMFQVVISSARDNPLRGGGNTLTIRKTQGDGGFWVSDFVIWFRQPATNSSARRPRPKASNQRASKSKVKKVRKRKTG